MGQTATPYTRISEAEAIERGITAQAEIRRDSDGVCRAYHQGTETYWVVAQQAQPTTLGLEEGPSGERWDLDLGAVRERLERRLMAATEELQPANADGRDYPYITHEVKELLEALQRVREVEPITVPAPPLDVAYLTSAVWTLVQEAGHPTAASDAAVEAIRRTLAVQGYEVP